MASRPQPIRLTRDQLSRFLPTPELVRAFESFIKQLAELTPDDIVNLTVRVDTAEEDAATALVAVSVAASTALRALQLAQQVEDLTGQLTSSHAQLHTLAQRVAALEERPTP